MSFKILVINPGSTSTKIGVYEDETLLFDKTLRHSAEDIAQFNSIPAQKDWRCQLVLKALREENFDINTLSAVSGRGGLLRPIRGGTYAVNDNLVNDCTIGVQGQHASNLGGIIVISQGSLYLALATFLRVAAIAVPGVILALGLDPTDLADGLVQILRLPQRFVYGGLAGMRMFTLLQDDWRALGQSRRSRGLGDGSTIKRVFSQAFSLLVVSIRRGTKLATAMEARGFGSDAPRSQARESKLHAVDWLFYAICIAVPAIALATAYYTGYWHWAFSNVSN